MDQQTITKIDLEEVRREIDAIDDELLELVKRRFQVVDQVRVAKIQEGTDKFMPLRPAREALIFRRLSEQNQGVVPIDLLVKVWRSIICKSTLTQAPVQINVTAEITNDPAATKVLTEHFVEFPLKNYAKIKTALNSMEKSTFELCAFQADTKWLDHMTSAQFSDIDVILTLPFTNEDGPNHIIIVGRIPAVPTGDDETLVMTKGRLPRDFVPAPLWETKTIDGHCLTSLPGFLSIGESPLIGLINSNPNLALKVLGRYPSPFEV